MRRRSLIDAIAASLCLGAVITVLVAFACAAWSGIARVRNNVGNREPPELATVIPPPWLIPRRPAKPRDFEFWLAEYRGVGLRIFDLVMGEAFNYDHRIYRTQAGWPLMALECSETLRDPVAINHGFAVPQWLGPAQRRGRLYVNPTFPLKPTPGFAADMFLYAGACFSFLGGIRLARHALRALKGRCVTCGYSRTGLPSGSPCPECGTTT